MPRCLLKADTWRVLCPSYYASTVEFRDSHATISLICLPFPPSPPSSGVPQVLLEPLQQQTTEHQQQPAAAPSGFYWQKTVGRSVASDDRSFVAKIYRPTIGRSTSTCCWLWCRAIALTGCQEVVSRCHSNPTD